MGALGWVDFLGLLDSNTRSENSYTYVLTLFPVCQVGPVSRNSLISSGVHGREKDVGLTKAGACLQQVPKMTKQMGFSSLHYPASRMGVFEKWQFHGDWLNYPSTSSSSSLLSAVTPASFQSVAGSSQDRNQVMATRRADSNKQLHLFLLNAKELFHVDGHKGGSPACESSPVSASGSWEPAHTPKMSRECLCRAGIASAGESFFSACISEAPRPFFKPCFGPMCSGGIRAGFLEGRRKGNQASWVPAWL